MKRFLILLLILFFTTTAYSETQHKATVLSVYDGDTATLSIELGLNVSIQERVRFLGIDTPEIRTRDKEEKAAGLEARDYVRDKILGKTVVVKIDGRGKFGRPLATIYYGEELINLNEELVEQGLALEYWGGKR